MLCVALFHRPVRLTCFLPLPAALGLVRVLPFLCCWSALVARLSSWSVPYGVSRCFGTAPVPAPHEANNHQRLLYLCCFSKCSRRTNLCRRTELWPTHGEVVRLCAAEGSQEGSRAGAAVLPKLASQRPTLEAPRPDHHKRQVATGSRSASRMVAFRCMHQSCLRPSPVLMRQRPSWRFMRPNKGLRDNKDERGCQTRGAFVVKYCSHATQYCRETRKTALVTVPLPLQSTVAQSKGSKEQGQL